MYSRAFKLFVVLSLSFFGFATTQVAQAAPHITSLSVTSGPEGTPVTITGTGFGTSTVTSPFF
jgi:hypothetical protein